MTTYTLGDGVVAANGRTGMVVAVPKNPEYAYGIAFDTTGRLADKHSEIHSFWYWRELAPDRRAKPKQAGLKIPSVHRNRP